MTVPVELGFVFPGQGSQVPGMLAGVAERYGVIEEVFAEASAALGFNLWQMCQTGPEAELSMTVNTQPALLAAGVALWRAWTMHGGPVPVVMAGHSLGEYTALVCAGSLEFGDAIRLVAERGRCMQDAMPAGAGAMAAILGLDDERVVEICSGAAAGEVVAAVNFNAPGQVVIAGNRAAVERAMQAAKAAGAKRTLVLPVSVPSHCDLMRSAAERFSVTLGGMRFVDAQIPVVQNVDALARTAAGELQAGLLRQLYSPVRWVDCVRTLKQMGAGRIVECGPGRVLSGLIKRIEPDMDLQAIGEVDGFNKALEAMT